MKERAASEGFLTQVSAVTRFFGWKFKCVTVGLKTTLEKKRKSSHDKTPCQEMSRGNNQHVN